MPGPPPTPTVILNQRGSWRGAARPSSEPQPPPGIPQPTVELEPECQEIFGYYASLIAAVPGLAAEIDGPALTRLAVLEWHFWDSVRRTKTRKKTYPIRDKNKHISNYGTHRHWQDVKDLASLLDKLGAKFGLTPADRSRISVTPQEVDTAGGKERFFKGVG